MFAVFVARLFVLDSFAFILCPRDTYLCLPRPLHPPPSAATTPSLRFAYVTGDDTGPVDLLIIAMAIVVGLPLFRLWLYHVYTILGKGQTTNEDMRREVYFRVAAACLFVYAHMPILIVSVPSVSGAVPCFPFACLWILLSCPFAHSSKRRYLKPAASHPSVDLRALVAMFCSKMSVPPLLPAPK